MLRMMKKLPRELYVLDAQRVSPSMHQVTLGGPNMQGFPADQRGGYVKLLLDQPGLSAKPMVRTYTIFDQREDAIDVQFALHGENAVGPATQWAIKASPGDSITVGGPGPAKTFPEGFEFYLVAGDMTALPAISVNLAGLPRDAIGHAVIEVQQEGDAIELARPDGFTIEWVVNPEPGTRPELLASALRAVEIPDGEIAGWVASEFSAMKELRRYLREELGLGPRELYISSYWKRGINESEHKQVKRADADAQPA